MRTRSLYCLYPDASTEHAGSLGHLLPSLLLSPEAPACGCTVAVVATGADPGCAARCRSAGNCAASCRRSARDSACKF
eukprot:5913179-Amphidinium_carterae.1